MGEAEILMGQAIAIVEKSYGPEHPVVTICLNNLATLLQDAGQLREAEPLMRRHLVNFLKLTQNTGYSHRNLQVACAAYRSLLQTMDLPENEREQRIVALARETGFDKTEFRGLMTELPASIASTHLSYTRNRKQASMPVDTGFHLT